MDIFSRIIFDRFLQITWIVAILNAIYIYLIAAREKRVFYYLLPFFIFTGMIIFKIGVFHPYTFVDSDMVTHQGIIDMILNRDLFKADPEMEFWRQIYTKGYHILLLPFILTGIPMPVISKLIGLLSGLLIPLLLYHLALVIYQERIIACLCALFSYTLTSLYMSSFVGMPRTIGIILYLLALIFIFKYQIRESLSSLIYFGISALLIFYIHQISFIFLFTTLIPFLILHFLKYLKRKNNFLFSFQAILAGLIIVCGMIFLINKFSLMDFSGRIFLSSYTDLLARTPDYPVTLSGILKEIGFIPVCFFLSYAIFGRQGADKYHLQKDFFLVSAFLFIFCAVSAQFETFYDVLVYRFPPILAVFFYITGLPTVANLLLKYRLKKKIVFIIIIFCSLMPSVSYIYKRLWWWIEPYGFHRNTQIYPKPKIDFKDDIKWLKEILAVSNYLKEHSSNDDVVASPMWCGDLIRLYSKRNVTSSWKVGGAARASRRAGRIFLKYADNTRKLYSQPDYLYRKYNAKYFVFDKSVPSKLTVTNSVVFDTENLKVVKIQE